MHYIRFLRPPKFSVVSAKQRPIATLSALVTITTDLGDSFLLPDRPVDLQLCLSISDNQISNEKSEVVIDGPSPSNKWQWTVGARVLKMETTFSCDDRFASSGCITIAVRTRNARLWADQFSTLMLQNSLGRIMAAYTDVDMHRSKVEYISTRRLRLIANASDEESLLVVEEEIGESIARHIWDAGTLAVAYLDAICCGDNIVNGDILAAHLRTLIFTEPSLNVLELGCGVGIFGLGLARLLGRKGLSFPKGITNILLTDLEDAEERASANISRLNHPNGQIEDLLNVNFEELDWEDGRAGRFGKRVRDNKWDLVILSDCTYNVDMLPALINTLSALHRHNMKQPTTSGATLKTSVLVATKPRHDSERAMFGLMSEAHWSIAAQTSLPLPVLGGEAQTVELYLFERG